MHLYAKIVNLPIKNNALHLCISEDNKYFFYFQDYLKILIGLHILVHIYLSIVQLIKIDKI